MAAGPSAGFSVTVAIATHGHRSWEELALERAMPSATDQAPIVRVHLPNGTLAAARNAALEAVESEWTIFLDADDELAPDYVEQMAKGSADLRAPAVLHKWPGWEHGPEVPRVWGHEHDCVGDCLRHGNWCCIGTAVRTDLVREVGGWEEFGWSEDWALFARCWWLGGSVEALPEAVYVAHHRRGSRNRVSRREGLRWHREIERAVFGEATA